MPAKTETLQGAIRDRVKELRRVPARELVANPKNWRKHPARQRSAMMAVLQEIGYADALIAREGEDGKLLLIDGHLRSEVTPDTIVPVLILDVDEKEADKILATLDPLSGMASADSEAFSMLASSIAASTPEFSDLLSALDGKLAGRENEDRVPAIKEIEVSRRGDRWVLGGHRLLCGDSSSADDVQALLGANRPRLMVADPDVGAGAEDDAELANPEVMVTDPPYGIELDSEWRDRAGLNGCGPAESSYMKKRTKGHNETTISGDTRADWSEAFALVPSLQVAYVWHASKFTREVLDGLLRIGFLHHQQIIWNKGRAVLTRTHYWFQHEPCWYVRKKNAPWFGTAGDNSTVWDSPSPKFIMGGSDEEKFDHPTQKPVELMRRPITNHIKPGGFVYEPFSGSGTTIIAAETCGRRALGMEIDPKYVDLIVRRWEAFTGKSATLDSDGRTFAEVSAERLPAAVPA